MKKFFVFAAVALTAMTASAAYNLNNPVGTDGRYIVKWDCDKGAFAASNDMEMDEAFTLAVDVTGTWLADWLLAPATNTGATRGVAFNHWTNKGNTHNDCRRLKKISGNIYGMTVCYDQVAADDFSDAKKIDSILYVTAQIFGFEYTADDAGKGWWMWNENPVEVTKAPASPDDALFALAPYTGTKTSEVFYVEDFAESMFGIEKVSGYAAPCVDLSTGIEQVVTMKEGAKFIENGQLYIISNGVKYNAVGATVK